MAPLGALEVDEAVTAVAPHVSSGQASAGESTPRRRPRALGQAAQLVHGAGGDGHAQPAHRSGTPRGVGELAGDQAAGDVRVALARAARR